eukprot:snap_masked-scaffold_2-processed-gene-13.7-mRNA-1 protein AED:0.04 eAED:0.08 QI:0/-1/0/1/-1/1/1/0/236
MKNAEEKRANEQLFASWKVFFWLPNIIDYFRFIVLFFALYKYVQDKNPFVFSALYLLSYGLDAIDGPVARYMGQTSKLGIYLDMIADRVSSCLLLNLAAEAVSENHLTDFFASLSHRVVSLEEGFYLAVYLSQYFCLLVVEIIAHIVVMIQSEKNHIHQKEMYIGSQSTVVKLYLGNKKVLFTSCFLFEIAGLSLLMDLSLIIYFIAFPGFLFRVVANCKRLLDVTIFRKKVLKQN